MGASRREQRGVEMFVQVIQAQKAEADGLRRQMQRWETDVRPGATGFLGSTGGVTDDGRMIAIVRFASADEARRNGERPEQGAWWADTEKLLEDVTFTETEDVQTMLGGGSDTAGFVQVIQGRATDEPALRALFLEMERLAPEHRPDILGAGMAWHGDSHFTEVVWFTSEADARAAEERGVDETLREKFAAWETGTEDLIFWDLHEPLLS